ncbi:MAG: pyridoxal phosphate-dependent aminotransferase family protein [Deltaproteobacteria bacterium]|nr:pyridoxal phosphate-dependent aminotransferase family protein [Deltaproteobacteria bacterium]
MPIKPLQDRCKPFAQFVRGFKAQGVYPYFRPISRSWGTEVEMNGRRLIMIGSNDYLGLSHDPRVMEAAVKAMQRWGTGPGGSRFLSGNLTLHEALEERLAAFVGKKKAVVHVTGFSTNLGSIACLLTADDVILYDRENHASLFEGCHASKARLIPFAHNDAEAAALKVAAAREKYPGSVMLLITEGVFSMSGDVPPLAELAQLKKEHPNLLIYLDDAHGVGVMGPGGRGTAEYFGLTAEMDFIMGTFSKALASVGGFLAGDDEDVLEYVRHQSKTLIFSAGLPASCGATVLACLDIIEAEPERVERLWEINHKVRAGYHEIGLLCGEAHSPVIPIHIGSELKAGLLAADLLDHGIFALPAIFPAVPRGKALIRTAYMSTHQDSQVDYVLEVLDRLARKHRVLAADLGRDGDYFRTRGVSSLGRTSPDPAVSLVSK